jgi:hypothetical protein
MAGRESARADEIREEAKVRRTREWREVEAGKTVVANAGYGQDGLRADENLIAWAAKNGLAGYAANPPT